MTDALEPHIDGCKMEIHYEKHHQSYVKKLNAALESHSEWQNVSIEELLTSLDKVSKEIRTAVRKNGGGHANHMLFWLVLGQKGGGRPDGELAGAIESAFGSIENFQEKFTEAALGHFGSGWALASRSTATASYRSKLQPIRTTRSCTDTSRSWVSTSGSMPST